MDDLDFSKPAASSSYYEPALAMEFFRLAGKPESVAKGETIFAENDKASRLLLKRDKMYLLLEGEVDLVAQGKSVGKVKLGEIFGEMALISQAPRSASAVANAPSKLIAMDDKDFETALRKKPEFALMFMSILIGRLRDFLAKSGAGVPSADAKAKESRVFNQSQLAALVRALGDGARVAYTQDKVIMKEGDAGVVMYIVLEGRVAITVKSHVVEKIGQGGVFGEMALVDRTTRLASATAETHCSLLAINRNIFLNLVKASPDFAISLLSAVGERVRNAASRGK
jgi:CRP-like cAMP-binding protein